MQRRMDNMRKVWILDNCYDEYEVFESLADARKAAEALMRNWKDVTKEEINEVLKEIDESYDEKLGFQSADNFYCWQISYHAKENG
jgi:Zn-dependent oligopeptidase